MSAAGQSNQATTHRARLRGEALRKWYAQSGNLTPDEWEAEQKRLEDERRGPARLFLAVAFILILVSGFLMGPILVAILSIWLVIGSGSFWVRMAVTIAAIFLLAAPLFRVLGPEFLAMLLATLFVSSAFAYLGALILPQYLVMPSRSVQFSLRQLSVYTLILAASLAVLRGVGFRLENEFRNMYDSAEFFYIVLCVSINVVLASLPILVPVRYRSGSLFRWSALWVVIQMPVIELLVLIFSGLFTSYQVSRELGPLTIVGHLFAPAIVWVVLYTMEGAQAFSDVKPLTYDKLDVESDPLGSSTTI
ncbi:hypothetical protein AB1K70_22580 [Bremerella sp. JC770]|uniref:hypothetical protein n=1 Tax=Bremerella sp. JC770 TaxID=3232137 RepID=UPI003459E45E